ncbi:MAG: DNA repair exonuclease [Spirochaetales bacterium]|nr:DNA repair exonuclease [Spirochaetales bacterium]
MSFKILATSDLHLGMRFSGYPELQEALSSARFQTLARLVELADREQCGLMVIAGDLFHRLTVPPREIRMAAEILAEFQGQAVAVLPGNHDFLAGPASPLWGSFRDSLERIKADRVMILDRPEPVDLTAYGLPVLLYPAPCASKHGKENNIGWIRRDSGVAPDSELLHLGIAHGSIEGLSPDAQGEYFPMKRSELERAGLDLWIVGHTHRQHPQEESSREWLLVPGTPEPDGFDCPHEGAAWLLEISADRQVRRKRLVTGRYRFRREQLEIDETTSPAQALARFATPEFQNTLLRLELKGRLSRERIEELRRVMSTLRAHLPWLAVDESALGEMITARTIAQEFPEGSFSARLLNRLLEAQEEEALQAAYDLLLEARP